MKKNLRHWVFLLCLVLFFVMFDIGLAWFGEEVWPYAANDYEVTKAAHPEEVWDRVFFGSSAVSAAYREHLSESGYVNLGLDYGVVTDLWGMLHQGHIDIGSELVIGLNLFTLYDDFSTNPTYIWHRGAVEPYAYFHRDKVLRMARQTKNYLTRGEPIIGKEKELYYGTMTDAELAEKEEHFKQTYFWLPMEDFQENIATLDKIADWCDDHGVRLRILWMPFHPAVERPELMLALMETVNHWCAERGIPVEDYTDKMEEAYFYDVGHLNNELGAIKFTEVIDPWLLG